MYNLGPERDIQTAGLQRARHQHYYARELLASAPCRLRRTPEDGMTPIVPERRAMSWPNADRIPLVGIRMSRSVHRSEALRCGPTQGCFHPCLPPVDGVCHSLQRRGDSSPYPSLVKQAGALSRTDPRFPAAPGVSALPSTSRSIRDARPVPGRASPHPAQPWRTATPADTAPAWRPRRAGAPRCPAADRRRTLP